MNHFRVVPIAVVCLLVTTIRATAQSNIFLDRNYIVRMAPEMGLMYEAQTAIPLFLNDKVDGLYASILAREGGWSTGRTLVVTPMFRIRQLTDKAAASSPVRTPSFMPKLTAQLLAARRVGAETFAPAPDFPITALVVGIDGTFGHHSNGQAGCFRANERTKPGGHGDCELDPNASPGSDTLNTVDGSFSTWYFRVQGHARLARYNDEHLLMSITIGGGIDWHPAFLQSIGGMDSALAVVYGRQRPFWSVELARRSEWPCPGVFALRWIPCGAGRLRASVNTEYINTRPVGVSPVATTAELAWTFSRYAGIGALVRFHRGQDYYNIALGHELNVTQFGFTIDLERDRPLARGATTPAAPTERSADSAPRP
jgi:hypothetical protein